MRILHPTDFSQAANRALALAFDLRRRLAASLHIVHVQLPVDEAFESYLRALRFEPSPELWERLMKERQAETERRLKQLKGLADDAATTELIWGKPLIELLRLAPAYDLIAMGAHGEGPLDAVFLGGVAGRLLRRSPVPVLTARESCQVERIERVLLATDFGEASKHAWQQLAPWRRAGIEMVLLHVVDDRRLQDDPGYIQTVTEAMSLLSQGEAKRHLVREGDVVETVLKAAEEVGADLIAIGLRRHGAAAGLLFGSSADALVRLSALPVVSVPLVAGR